MATKTKSTTTRKVYYRRARFAKPTRQTLQQMVNHGLNVLAIPGRRLEPLGSMATEFRCIAGWRTVGHYLCGHIVTFDRDRYQIVVDDDPDAMTLRLTAVPPPSKGKVKQQFVPGILFFVIYKNHVVVLQATNLRASALEHHLLWLLRSKTATMSSDQGFGLADEPQKATRERIRKSHVKSVMIGRPLMEEVELEEDSRRGEEKISKVFRPVGPALSLLKELLDPNQFEKLGLDDAVFAGNLEVWIQIRHPKRRRVKEADSVKLLDDISIALRDLDEEEARLKLNDGSTVYGKELKITGDIELRVEGAKGMVNEGDAYEQMIAWLEMQIRNGIVTPD